MYKETRNNLSTFVEMDAFWNEDVSVEHLIDALGGDNWQVQQAALSAIGDRGELSALDAIAELLNIQDKLPIYDCPDEWELCSARDENEREIWRCRFRVKQAAVIAVGKLIDKHGFCIDDALLQKIMNYAVNQNEDYSIRMASCEILGKVKTPETIKVLVQASHDGEACTRMTAERALINAEIESRVDS